MKLKHRIAPSVYDVCLRATMLQETLQATWRGSSSLKWIILHFDLSIDWQRPAFGWILSLRYIHVPLRLIHLLVWVIRHTDRKFNQTNIGALNRISSSWRLWCPMNFAEERICSVTELFELSSVLTLIVRNTVPTKVGCLPSIQSYVVEGLSVKI